ncbi:hypothetical protein CN383_12180 [Priestia megaterium]|uniref:sulfotransferase family 2 domain-containing protein n=1 Tax=Priestia megaterium TaxID=1404 RepID=UPI000BF816C2|nr:sulfotransferase family 2 domain-containing protein [Priestia megaterium]PFB01108.1 hypothetical protein CN383_12180 [Priestia megaterium]
MTDSILIFMHIPKTGGSTLNEIFKNQYKEDEVLIHIPLDRLASEFNNLSDIKRDKIKGISGHYNFGVHEHINKPYTYFSIVRHPIDRVISLYYFLSRSPGYARYEELKGMTLEEFVTKNKQANNHQTLFFSGNGTFDLALAKKNLENHFPVVGVTDMFNESTFLMTRKFNWEYKEYKKVNVTPNRPSLKEIPNNILNIIEQNNHLDMELYNYVKERLVRQLDLLSPEDYKKMQQNRA